MPVSVVPSFAKSLALTSLVATLGALPAAAQNRTAQFELGFGAKVTPLYEGSDTYQTGPAFSGGVTALSMGSINFAPGDNLGFGFGPSFRYLAAREAADDKVLTGIDDIDAALELGARLSYRWQGAEAYAALRAGVTGHDGLVLDLGADAIWQPGANTTIRMGPRLSLADQNYMDTYFSVPGSATRLGAYDADGGMKSYGFELSVRQELSDAWALEGVMGYDRLTGSAADSPIVQAGSENQGSLSIQLVRKFNLRF